MTRREYLDRLSALLRQLPSAEREDALRYYTEYLDAAGEENEEAAMRELGSPETVAQSILEGSGRQAASPAGAEAGPQRRRYGLAAVAAALVLAFAALLGVVVVLNFADLRRPSESVRSETQSVSPLQSGDAPGAPPDSVPDETQSGLPADASSASEQDGLMTYTYDAAQVTALEIDLSLGGVRLEKGAAGTGITLTVEPAEGVTFREKLENGRLKLINRVEKQLDREQEGPLLVLTLPEDLALDRVEIETAMGSIRAGDLSAQTLTLATDMGSIQTGTLDVAGTAELETAMGSVKVEALNAGGEAKLSAGMGSMTVGLLDAPAVDAECGMGSLTLTLAGSAADYAVTASCEMGVLKYDGKKYDADRKMQWGSGSRTAVLSCDMGALTVDFCA